MRRRFREVCGRPSAAAACACRALRIRAFGGALPILTVCRKYIEFLSGAAEYRVHRLAPGSPLGKRPLLVMVRTIEIQFPRKGHSFPPCSVASAISGKRYRNVSRCCVTIRYKLNCDCSMRNPVTSSKTRVLPVVFSGRSNTRTAQIGLTGSGARSADSPSEFASNHPSASRDR